MMKLSSEWIEHSPDFDPCIRDNGMVNAEADCPCGITERHQHCRGCGRVACKGDWDAPPIAEWKMKMPIINPEREMIR